MYNSQNLPLSPLKVIKKSIPAIILNLVVFGGIIGFIAIIDSYDGDPLTSSLSETRIVIYPILFGLSGLFFLVILLWEYLYYKTYFYNFEEQNAEIRKGVISRATGHVKYDRLQDIYIDQDVLDRIFGLYDVHYETAGEISHFYSHVDGLNKENTDKLIAFLNEKVQSSFESKKAEPVASQSPNLDLPTVAASIANEELINRQNCPVSAIIIFTRSLAGFIGLAGLVFFISFFIWAKTDNNLVMDDFNTSLYLIMLIGLVVVFLLILIYQIIWFHNFYYQFDHEKGEIRTQVISRSISYLYYPKIQNVNLSQGILGRILGIYNLQIETAGETSGQSFVLDGFRQAEAERLKNFLLAKAKSARQGL